MNKLTLAFAVAVGLSACGGGSDSKDLFSLWNRDGDNAPLDLRGGGFSSTYYMYMYPAAAPVKCICESIIIGDQSTGSYALTGCIVSPYNASDNQYCQALDQSGSYTNSGSALVLTNRQTGASTGFH